MTRPATLDELMRWLDRQSARLADERALLVQELEAAQREFAAVEPHPNHHAYALGKVFSAVGFGVADLEVLHFWLWLDWPAALGAISDEPDKLQPQHLLHRLRETVAEWPQGDTSLRSAAADYALQTKWHVPPTWLREGAKLGMGIPLRDVGLRASDTDAFAGLWTVPFRSLTERVSAAAASHDEPLVMVIPHVLAASHEYLDRRGKRSNFLRARDRYRRRCTSFAEFDAAAVVKAWRQWPPTARQGHLILATARALKLDPPSLPTRGEAADWLSANGGNPRFKEATDEVQFQA